MAVAAGCEGVQRRNDPRTIQGPDGKEAHQPAAEGLGPHEVHHEGQCYRLHDGAEQKEVPPTQLVTERRRGGGMGAITSQNTKRCTAVG